MVVFISVRYKSKSGCFCWVPTHVGIKGNEDADPEAKIASTLNDIYVPAIPHLDMGR